jgi:uncharacterized RDD family membrane protein YckC
VSRSVAGTCDAEPAPLRAYAEPPTTPDGVPLAAWWSRVAAFIIDTLIFLAVVIVVSMPFWGQIERGLRGPILAIGLISAAIDFSYHVGFLMWKQATPGKLILGLRVRRRDVAGPMPLGTVLLRWVTQFGPALVLGFVPYLGNVGSLYNLLDGAWPLWDSKRQALHDKAAKTNVVRVR